MLLFEFMLEFEFPFEFEFLFLFRPRFEFVLPELLFDMLPFDMLLLLVVVVVVLLELPLEFLFPQVFAKSESASRSRTTMPCLIRVSPVVED